MNILERKREDSFPFSKDVEARSAIEVMRLQLIYFSIMEISRLFKKKNHKIGLWSNIIFM